MKKVIYSSIIASFLVSKEVMGGGTFDSITSTTTLIERKSPKIFFSLSKVNDTIDIFGVKDTELKGSNLKSSSIGDMSGYSLSIKYPFKKNFMFFLKNERQNIEYYDTKIKNNRIDTFLRYHLMSYKTFFSGFSFDIGFVSNTLNDFQVNDKNSLNSFIKKAFPNKNVSLKYSDGTTKFFGAPFPSPKGYYLAQNNKMTKLKQTPYLSFYNTNDKSLYLRVLTGFNTKSYIFDIYAGYKKTKIKSYIGTTNEIIKYAQDRGITIQTDLDRSEEMYFAGFNHIFIYKKIMIEFNYEYEKFSRDKKLDYIDYNHIVKSFIGYRHKRYIYFIGGKLMLRQFNGQIPYLYNKYTQTTYDHKYGYAVIGVGYRF